MTEEAARFRRELEEKTGEKVVEVAMAGFLETGREREPEWGLLVLTDRSIRFTRPPSRHWLASLFQSRGRDEAPPEDIVMPLAEGTTVSMPRRGFLARVFGTGYRPYAISWQEGGTERRSVFQVDPRAPMADALAAIAAPPVTGASTS